MAPWMGGQGQVRWGIPTRLGGQGECAVECHLVARSSCPGRRWQKSVATQCAARVQGMASRVRGESRVTWQWSNPRQIHETERKVSRVSQVVSEGEDPDGIAQRVVCPSSVAAVPPQSLTAFSHSLLLIEWRGSEGAETLSRSPCQHWRYVAACLMQRIVLSSLNLHSRCSG